MNIFSKAAAGVTLTPAERAALKLVIGIVITALFAGGDAIVQYLTSPHDTIDWNKVITVGVIAFVSSLAFALHKYITAHGDVVIGATAPVVTPTPAPAQPQNNTVAPAAVETPK